MQPPKHLNGILAVDSPVQTLAVDFSLNLYTSSTTARSRNTSFIISLFDAHLTLFLSESPNSFAQVCPLLETTYYIVQCDNV